MALASSEDLITEILLRLPVKSILLFKTVSKQWLSIASSPLFRKIHASRSRSSYATGLFLNTSPVYKFVSLISSQITPSFVATIGNREILYSSGGLLLLRSRPFQSSDVPDYFVCNPTTNEIKKLAFVPQPIIDSVYYCPYLAFDPRKSPHYKIYFLFLCPEQLYDTVIYSSESERFSSLPRRLAIPSVFRICGGYCNNAMHWISNDGSLHYFDFSKELWMTIDGPPIPIPDPDCLENCWYFGECEGHVFLLAVIDDQMFVYELKSDYSGWSRKYLVDLPSMANAFPEGGMIYSRIRDRIWYAGGFRVITVVLVNKEDEESLTLVFGVHGHYVTYNFKNRQFVILKNWCSLCKTDNSFNRLYSWQYIQTLACV